jgi:hypothetical protein
MKKLITVTVILAITASTAFSQWAYEIVNNGFDGPFKMAYTNAYNYGWLTIENPKTEAKPLLYLSGAYFCDETTTVIFVFNVNNVSKKYTLNAYLSKDNKVYFFYRYIWNEQFTNDFKNASSLSIRINQLNCEDEYYEFNFTGSTAAYNFMTSK